MVHVWQRSRIARRGGGPDLLRLRLLPRCLPPFDEFERSSKFAVAGQESVPKPTPV